ncbi:phosphotransferase system, phosphocarrier protein HPr [Candidatus Omnitrophus magneticus]|uniref:Phosphotransferase system, phosphocarrier protein HPr n=1 Tax=Candidatus Omnitrophus magneticus TaxID=1609969 RepID=A0A0F0CX92_9BACT|nr:phosphotransferase system, phosphocarrier protein HPr [Candidatus Omnitrophus magneticus]
MKVEKEIVIKNKTGLHARPAALFVQAANKYKSEITLIKEGQSVNGKSIMGILMLAAEMGVKMVICAVGDDAEDAVTKLSAMLMSDDLDT